MTADIIPFPRTSRFGAVLKAHIAHAQADALREAAHEIKSGGPLLFPDERAVVEFLRDKAERVEGGGVA